MKEVKKISLTEEILEMISGGVNFKKTLNKICSKICSEKSNILLIGTTVTLTASTIAGISCLFNKKESNNDPVNDILLNDGPFYKIFEN